VHRLIILHLLSSTSGCRQTGVAMAADIGEGLMGPCSLIRSSRRLSVVGYNRPTISIIFMPRLHGSKEPRRRHCRQIDGTVTEQDGIQLYRRHRSQSIHHSPVTFKPFRLLKVSVTEPRVEDFSLSGKIYLK